jgi:hypothetical protein
MRSWLNSPAVQLLSLTASLLALGQFTVVACKRLSAILRGDHERRQVYNAAALAGLVALAVCAPLAWSGDIQVAREGINGETLGGVLFPVMMTLSCVLGCTLLCFNVSFPRKKRPLGPLWPGFFIVLGLGTIVGMRFGVATMPPVWEFCVLIGFPGLVVAIYMLAVVLDGVDQIRVVRDDSVWRRFANSGAGRAPSL